MEAAQPLIRLKLDVDQPIELGEFVAAFTAMSAEYDRFVRTKHPGVQPEASLFVRQVRAGCIEAELVQMATIGGVFAFMENVNTVTDFVNHWGSRLMLYREAGGRAPDATKTELNHIVDQIAAIASAPNAGLELAAIKVENGDQKVEAAFKFTSAEAQTIQATVEQHKLELEHKSHADHMRVAMRFTRTDTGPSTLGKRSGENVIIEVLSSKRRPLIYASDLAEAAIKHEIREAEDNVYKKVFVVDVNVETQNGKPFAYRVTHLHQVIDAADDGDES